MIQPSPTELNGRDETGRFAPGNRFAQGNPYAKQVNEWRKAIAQNVMPDDIRQVVLKLVELAKEGKPWAIKELLDRTCGKSVQMVVTEDLNDTRTAEDKLQALRRMLKLNRDDSDRSCSGN